MIAPLSWIYAKIVQTIHIVSAAAITVWKRPRNFAERHNNLKNTLVPIAPQGNLFLNYKLAENCRLHSCFAT